MTLVSHGKFRDYPLKFDHQAAIAEYERTGNIAVTARKFGVSPTSIRKLVVPGVEQSMRETSRLLYTATCESCGGPCLSIRHPAKAKTTPDGRELCQRCRGKEKRDRFRFDRKNNLVAVRCAILDCANGEHWQPPEHFTKGARYHDLRKGGIHGECRACQTRARREYRQRNPEQRERENARRMERYYAEKSA